MKFMWGEGAKGLLIGAGLGALSGLSAGEWLLGDLLYVGVAILVGAVVCSVAGLLWGESFFEWAKDCWHWFF